MNEKLTFDIKKFWEFCACLRVDTKERGEILLTQNNISGTQRYFIEEIAKGINSGIHTFVALKGRQVHITTICLALDLYWLGKYPGVHGSLVTNTEEVRDGMRNTLTTYIEGLPSKYKHTIKANNRYQLIYKENRSQFSYQVAGTRKNPNLGRSKGISFLHGTEVAFWGDPEGIASLESSLAEINPHRLFIWETTANGYNHFLDMWEDAKTAHTRKAIFIGWWRNEFYTIKKTNRLFDVYGDSRLSPTERKWVNDIKRIYNFEINTEQMAWWRWKMNEVIKDEDMMYQEFPPTEEYAFILSGSQYFNSARLNDEMKRANKLSPQLFRFNLRDRFEDTELDACSEKFATLRIWEFPKPGGYYAVGADPAYGSSSWADRFCVSIWRCYADGMDQVAEFNTAELNPYQFAWVTAYLCGAYKNSILNLEINGPGQGVWAEFQNMKRTAASMGSAGQGMMDVIANIQHFLYSKNDSLSGIPTAYHSQTTYQSKELMMSLFKDGFERGSSRVASVGLLDEMRNVIRSDGDLGAPGRGKDDRVIASALAHVAWHNYTRMRLMSAGITRASAHKADGENQQIPVNNVRDYMKRMGILEK